MYLKWVYMFTPFTFPQEKNVFPPFHNYFTKLMENITNTKSLEFPNIRNRRHALEGTSPGFLRAWLYGCSSFGKKYKPEVIRGSYKQTVTFLWQPEALTLPYRAGNLSVSLSLQSRPRRTNSFAFAMWRHLSIFQISHFGANDPPWRRQFLQCGNSTISIVPQRRFSATSKKQV